jgi:hypothetical protein
MESFPNYSHSGRHPTPLFINQQPFNPIHVKDRRAENPIHAAVVL